MLRPSPSSAPPPASSDSPQQHPFTQQPPQPRDYSEILSLSPEFLARSPRAEYKQPTDSFIFAPCSSQRREQVHLSSGRWLRRSAWYRTKPQHQDRSIAVTTLSAMAFVDRPARTSLSNDAVFSACLLQYHTADGSDLLSSLELQTETPRWESRPNTNRSRAHSVISA